MRKYRIDNCGIFSIVCNKYKQIKFHTIVCIFIINNSMKLKVTQYNTKFTMKPDFKLIKYLRNMKTIGKFHLLITIEMIYFSLYTY